MDSKQLSESKRALLEQMRKGRVGAAAATTAIPRRPPGPAPLSFAQQRLWFIHQIDPESPAYNVPLALRLTGELHVHVLARCLREVAARHESLRTRFPRQDGMPMQTVDPKLVPDLPLDDLSSQAPAEREQEAERIAGQDAATPFDLERGPLIRARLLRLAPRDHVFLLSMHHIVSDGWSMGVLIREIVTLYDAFAHDRPSPLPALAIQYADYAAWQRSTLVGERLERELDYWRQRLSPLPPPLDLPTDRPRPSVQTFRGGVASVTIPRPVAAALRDLSRREGATLFMTLVAGFDVLLAGLTGEKDLAIGTPVANRTRTEIEPLIGFFVNALVLRVDCSGDPTFTELVRRVREVTLGAYAHQDLPFDRIVEELQPVRDLSRNPLFQVAIALQNAPFDDLELPGLAVDPVAAQSGAARFDLELHLWETAADGIDGFLFYGADLFDPSTIHRFVDRWATLLTAAAENPEARLSELPLISPAESRLLPALGAGPELTVEPRTAAAWFARVADRDSIALDDGNVRVSYRELDRRANHLANRLAASRERPPSRVGILADRSLDAVVAVVAAAKLDAAYVPLDPAQPDARLTRFVELAGVDAIVAPRDLRDRAAGLGPNLFAIETEDGHDVPPAVALHPEAVAYVIFTSGSTGIPNGVEVTGANLANVICWDHETFGVTATDRAAWISAPGFDASVLDIWTTLAAGATLLIPTQETRLDPRKLRDWLVAERVTITFVPTPLAKPLLALRWPCDTALRALLAGGDRLPAVDVASLPFRVVNIYGPTETTIVTTSGDLDGGGSRPAPTLGRPIANAVVRVLDAAMRPVPVGVPGELWIGGAGVSRGYAGQPVRTAERFRPDPFAQTPGARLYRSGDLVRLLGDGRLEFLGRVDKQVKIRGQRIEPGEVEALLTSHPSVEAAAVLPHGDGDERRLVAYVALHESDGTNEAWAADHVARWRELYDETYSSAGDGVDDSFNVVGWNDSYTGEPIPADEMREWRDAAVARIRSLHPRRVLEIGCGTGLLLTQLAPDCERYVATDLSPHSVAAIRRAIARRPDLGHVEVVEREAADFSRLDPAAFDLVVLNSVVQYFPDAAYLERVLAGTRRCLARGGRIFLGDIRDLRLQRAFAVSRLSRSHGGGDIAESEIAALIAREEELLVHPAFWARFGRARALVKRGRADNEIARYRYDVLLEQNEPRPEAAAVEIAWSEDFVPRLAGALANAATEVVVRGVPNTRLDSRPGARHPDSFDEFAREHGRTVAVGLSWESPTSFDVAFPAAGTEPTTLDVPNSAAGGTNTPLRRTRAFAVVPELRAFASRHLPDAMVPSAFLVLDALPLTANGKIDRRALPAPADAERLPVRFVEPRDPIERAIALAWATVLRRSRISATDDFFDLGGHSLLATQVLARLRTALGVEVPLRAVFEATTVEGLARVVRELILEKATVRGPLERLPEGVPAPLSLAQQRLWFLDRLEPGGPAYHIPNALRLTGELDVVSLNRALAEIVRRHESLRTRFVERDGEPVQEIEAPYDPGLQAEEISGADLSAREEEVRRLVTEEVALRFDLERGPVFRARLYRLDERDHVLVIVIHHIAADGWSMGRLVRELTSLYTAYRSGRASMLPELPIQYADWAYGQRRRLGAGEQDRQLAHWRDSLRGVEPLELPVDRPRPTYPSWAGASLEMEIAAPLVRRLADEARARGATLHMTLLAALAAVLGRWSGQSDFAIGTPVAGRTHEETEPLIGFFVNTLAIRLDLTGGDLTFGEFLSRVRETTLSAYASQDVPFERVVEEVRPERDTSRNPLFQVMFALHNLDFGELSLPGVRIGSFEFETRIAQFDLELSLFETAEGLSGRLQWATDLFDRSTMERFSQSFARFVAAVTEDPDAPVADVPLFSEEELRRLAFWQESRPRVARSHAAATVSRAPRTQEEETACALFADALGVPHVAPGADFFDLGGHSLLAVRLLARARQSFGAEIPLRALFDEPTPVGLARAAVAARRTGGVALPALDRAPEPERRALSFAQRRLWFLDRLDPGGIAYNVPLALRIRGPLDIPALERALRGLAERHEALRTRFVAESSDPEQRFDVPAPALAIEDLSADNEPVAALERRLTAHCRRSFDLARGPLWRARLFRVAPNDHTLALTFHHIITDGWSMDVLLSDLAALYRGVALPSLRLQYADWAAWQRRWLEAGERERQLTYWREELRDVSPLETPTDFPRPARRGLRGSTVSFRIEAADVRGLRAVSREEGGSLFHALLACFQTLLGTLAATDDVVVGTPIANRTQPDSDRLVGFFANTIALRARHRAGTSLRQRIAAARAKTLEAYAHQDVPFETVVDELGVERDLSRNPLFDAMFSLQHSSEPAASGAPDEALDWEPLGLDTGATPFDLVLALNERDDGLEGSLRYDADLFEKATAERLAAWFVKLTGVAARTPDALPEQLDLQTEAEREIVRSWSDTARPETEQTLVALLDASCHVHADRDAVEVSGRAITYRELERRATTLAAALCEAGVGPESPVGLLADREVDAVVAWFAIWKAGGVAVPLDPQQPAARLDVLITDAGIRVVVATAGIEPRGLTVVRPDAVPRAGGPTPSPPVLRPANAAYIVYTSGSTGRPKGCVVEHRAIASVMTASIAAQRLEPGDRSLHALPFAFDAALDEILPALLAGATLVIHPDPRGDTARELLERLARERLTHVHLPPGLFHDLAFELEAGARVPAGLRHVTLGGEAPSGARIATFLRHAAPGVRVTNAYGPTEAVVAASRQDLERAEEARDPVPIGRPRPNTSLHLLDASLRRVPLGAIGEICISGRLARGYLGRPEATAAAFVPDPFANEPGERTYRTGDYARHRADGVLVFLGRRDGQIKLRGVRIELGEIEAALAATAGVREAAAGVRGEGAGARIVAWISPVAGTRLDPVAVRHSLGERLPGPWVPAQVVVLERLPRSATGKIDRRALPDPQRESGRGRRGPRGDREHAIATPWCETLHVDSVDVHDHFFEAGGNSLLAMRLVTAVRRATGRDVPVATVFSHPRFEDFARAVHDDDTAPRRRLVRLRAGDGFAPVVCLPGLGGGIAEFRALADALDPARPVWAATSVGTGVPECVEDEADEILSALEQVAGSGPVHLLGWSYGALTAFEIAARLRAAGREVGSLVLVDAVAPGAYDDLDALEFETNDEPDMDAWRAAVLARANAARRYRPEPWPGTALLVRGTESVTAELGDDTLGWSAWVHGGLEVAHVPGTHESILSGEGASRLAALVERHVSLSLRRD